MALDTNVGNILNLQINHARFLFRLSASTFVEISAQGAGPEEALQTEYVNTSLRKGAFTPYPSSLPA